MGARRRKGEMTMAGDARKEVSREWPTTSKRRCRKGAGQCATGDPILWVVLCLLWGCCARVLCVCSQRELPSLSFFSVPLSRPPGGLLSWHGVRRCVVGGFAYTDGLISRSSSIGPGHEGASSGTAIGMLHSAMT